jgi:hypothetical protein
MALVVLRLPSRDAGRRWKNWMTPIQRLHLALLIHAQDDRTVGGFRRSPTYDGHSASGPLLRPQARAASGCVGCHRFQCLVMTSSILLMGNLARCADPRLIKPSSPNSLNRSRHLRTVGARPPNCSPPCPQLSTIRAGIAMACADLGDAQSCSVSPNPHPRIPELSLVGLYVNSHMRPQPISYNVFPRPGHLAAEYYL